VHKYIPKEMMARPKTGFTMPIEDWLKTDLKYLVEENLNPSTLNKEIFNVENVCKIKNLFYQNKLGHEEKVIWRMLEFQLWYKYNIV
jgi:asparagine synthase (glutamine-hydrolysing)